jgi:hypothetical protein
MAKYDTVTKPALNTLFRADRKDLPTLKAAIDAAAAAGATPHEIVENVGGTSEWKKVVRQLRKANLA